jgi:HrpA-like RNA helicase
VRSYLLQLPPLISKRAVGGPERVNLSHFIAPQRGRQLILATIAPETSITIKDIAVVVDSGCTNTPIYDPVQRTHALTTIHASQSQIN